MSLQNDNSCYDVFSGFCYLSRALWECFLMAVSWLSTDVGVERWSEVRPVVEVTPASNTHRWGTCQGSTQPDHWNTRYAYICVPLSLSLLHLYYVWVS